MTKNQIPKTLSKFGYSKEGVEPLPQMNQEIVDEVMAFTSNYFDKSQRINPNHSSYGLKHFVENRIGKYVGNGELIAGMILAGFRYKQDAINAEFNVSESSYKSAIGLPVLYNNFKI